MKRFKKGEDDIMPNWVINRIKIENGDIKEVLKEHFTKQDGKEEFDFNTIDCMPKDVQIEKSSRSSDGFKLYIAKINPLILNIGCADDKMSPDSFFKKMVSLFGKRCIDNIENYILRMKDIEFLKNKYEERLDEVIELGHKVFTNIEKYGVGDWYDWACQNWGCKWNCCNTAIIDNAICFDTPWSASDVVIEKLALMHKDLKIIHEYAEEQTGFMCGYFEYENGILKKDVRYEPFCKEAFELSFELWGKDEHYVFNKDTNTYEYFDTNEEVCS